MNINQKKQTEYVFIFLALFVVLILCKEYIKRNYISRDSLSIACPIGSHFTVWPDTYSNQPSKATGIGCFNQNDDINGWHIAWQAQGVKEHEGSQIDGLAQGEWTYYHKNGKIRSRGYYINGEKDGAWKYWDDKGLSLGSAQYSKGKFIKARDNQE